MPVCLEHSLHAEALAEFQQLFVLVRRVEQHRITRRTTSHDEHVVVDRADHQLVDLDVGVRPVQGVGRCHPDSLAAFGQDPVSQATAALARRMPSRLPGPEYAAMQKMARMPSRHPIFLPSS